MKKKLYYALLGLLFSFQSSYSQTKHAQTTQYPSYKGLIMAGYQGWFRAEGDGVNQGFSHYATAKEFNDKTCKIDAWPDVSEYQKTYNTSFKLPNGQPAKVFSSVDKSTVDLHFKWMKDYGVDGVFVQRFVDYVRDKAENAPHNIVLKNTFEAASNYDRAIAVMYDLSGLRAKGEDLSIIIEDWKMLVDKYSVTNQAGKKTYLHDKGRPVVAIWGVGFPDRPYNMRNIGLERLIDFLKNDPVYGGCAVMFGVPTGWRTLNADCTADSYLHEIIKQSDIILPWTVQRFTPLLHNDMDRFRDLLIEDMKWCRENNVSYVPCICPGFSWHNLSKAEFPDDVKPVASIPRQGGRFYWQQISTALASGAQMLYVAMFDEVDEGTAIFKINNQPPVDCVSKFITNDNMPSDHYLWLTGEAAKMLRKEKSLNMSIPLRGN